MPSCAKVLDFKTVLSSFVTRKDTSAAQNLKIKQRLRNLNAASMGEKPVRLATQVSASKTRMEYDVQRQHHKTHRNCMFRALTCIKKTGLVLLHVGKAEKERGKMPCALKAAPGRQEGKATGK